MDDEKAAWTFTRQEDDVVPLEPMTWRQTREAVAVCLPLRRGRYRLRLA